MSIQHRVKILEFLVDWHL
ncbi:hypothetical protein F7R14_23640 [Pseudomonas lini]|uniref:WHIM1 domain-containing protein n=1 Tax=Pseudomonas lini TaxID=163011 RepID=A0A7V7P0Y3_9PSED|nr:hypothetical protein F7R14_23640 [Pseudomonas lini]MDT9674320.1 hypothetical protein [Pseudomonas sp. JV414]